jgi:hypothetical protein
MDSNKILSRVLKIKISNKLPLGRPSEGRCTKDSNKRGHRHKTSAYGRTKKNGKSFVVRQLTLMETSTHDDDDNNDYDECVNDNERTLYLF